MKYSRVRYKLYRALAWGLLFDVGICLLINYLIPPLGLTSLKMSSYFLTILIVGGLACTTTLSYCGLRYLDKISLYFCTKLTKLCGKKHIKNHDILIEDNDLLIVSTQLVKGLGNYETRQRFREAQFTRPQNESAIFSKSDFTDQAAIDNFNQTVQVNASQLYRAGAHKKIAQLQLREDGALIVKYVSIFTTRGDHAIKITPDGVETVLKEIKSSDMQQDAPEAKSPGSHVSTGSAVGAPRKGRLALTAAETGHPKDPPPPSEYWTQRVRSGTSSGVYPDDDPTERKSRDPLDQYARGVGVFDRGTLGSTPGFA